MGIGKNVDHTFEEGELKDRIREALHRASAAPGFEEFRSGLASLDLSRKQRAFMQLWIEEALRHSRKPSGRQTADAENEERRRNALHLSLTVAQRRELVRVFDEPFPDDRAGWRDRKRIPMTTYRVLHSAGLVSTTENVTELGAHVARRLKSTKDTL